MSNRSDVVGAYVHSDVKHLRGQRDAAIRECKTAQKIAAQAVRERDAIAKDCDGWRVRAVEAETSVTVLAEAVEILDEYFGDAERHAGKGWTYIHPGIPRERVDQLRAALALAKAEVSS